MYDAQLKKKEIEVEIQMTTLKQKIEMMSNFKTMTADTKEKMEKSEVQGEKISSRLAILDKKEEEHGLVLAKAHLVL